MILEQLKREIEEAIIKRPELLYNEVMIPSEYGWCNSEESQIIKLDDSVYFTIS